MTLKILQRIEERLDQSNRLRAQAGIELSVDGRYPAGNDLRNSLWQCILCRHGNECRNWLDTKRPGIPDFCPNRGYYERQAISGGDSPPSA